MKKRNLIILIVLSLVIIGLAAFYFLYYIPNQTASREGELSIDDPLFPFGNIDDIDSQTPGGIGGEFDAEGDQDPDQRTAGEIFVPSFREISSRPSTAGGFVEREGELFIRYIERETGHIFEASVGNLTQERLTNTTIPRVYEALWSQDGESVVLRYLREDDETIQSFSGRIATLEEDSVLGEGSLEGIFLSAQIKDLDFFGNQIFSLIKTSNGSIGIVSDPDDTNKNQVFSSPLNEWLVGWPSRNTITLTTKPSSGIPGYLYFLDIGDESLERVLGGISNLTTLTNLDLSKVLYSTNGSLRVLDRASGESVSLSLNTLPEKCVWGKINSSVVYCGIPKSLPAGLPETWYQGLISLSDDIWKINTDTGQTDVLVMPRDEYGIEIDLTKPSLDEDERYLLFLNKKDSSLWILKI